MSTSVVLDRAANQAMPNPTGTCNACQRTGLPILPLRAVYAPQPGNTRMRNSSTTGLKSIPMRLDQPRILRQGYLYVLLDKKEWQAYQVTPEGALRQFRPYQPPREEPQPLSEACIKQDHDVTASFINIDANKYSSAWIAIANDPWPKKVLDQYLRGTADDGTALDSRFHKIDLKAARENPADVGIAMTENNLQMHQVLEYAEATPGDFDSVHGFYSRNHRLGALMGHVRTLIQREKLPGGVLALVLPDPIGMVQECNAQRVNWFRSMQEWRSEPQRRFELFTSQALLGIKQLQDGWAAAEAAQESKAELERRRKWNQNPYLAEKATMPPLDIEADTKRRTKSKKDEARERLEERYDEAARARFEAAYLKELEVWQKVIDSTGELYAYEYQAAPFKLAAQYDYSVTSIRSVEGFIRMMGLCLFGGPTELIEKDQKKLGATQRLWKTLLEDRKSLLYQALLAKDQMLLDQLQTALAGDDLGKVYDTIKSIIATDEGKQLMVTPVKEAIGQILAATANASNALMQHLSTQTHALVGHVHSAAFLRYAGQAVTQIIVSLKLGEYLSLLNEVLQERTDEFLTQLDQKFRKPAERRIRAMVLSGAITIAVSSNHGKMVDVMFWSLDSAESLQKKLEKLRTNASTGVTEALRTVSIGAATLQTGAAELVHNLTISAQNARTLAKGAMRQMRTAAISAAPAGADLLLGLGSLWFQQDSLRRNYETFLKSPGSGNAEALAAVWSSSIGVMGVGVEIVGVSTQILRPGLTSTVRVAGQTQTVMLGTRIAQYGGAIAAVAGVMDGAQYVLAASRVEAQGDVESATSYRYAAGVVLVSAYAGAMGAIAGSSALLGPVGIAIVLGLAAYAIAMRAKKQESSALELWARHSVWGIPKKHRQWERSEDADTAIGALNAAVLGVVAEIDLGVRFQRASDLAAAGSEGVIFTDGMSIPAGIYLDYKIFLPGYEAKNSRYMWAMKVFRPGGDEGEVIASGNSERSNSSMPSNVSRKLDYNPKTSIPVVTENVDSHTLSISGAIALNINHSINAVELEVSFWPDTSDESGAARLIVKEDKIDN
ncbi:Lead, cadmium, zinc and mercury transporting ATPase [Pseudomonas chlororaphis subsp. aureofaciens]|uniref:T6SS effector BTH_I2691 family protein n=1 Tax=Pseudomonas chlororaphis TaxID=587753 RepID=UPI000F55BF21|nr:T6SS effector BTH_I2691 family protein [Pseudomonas chlororaphis]AZD86916.1 Lead, cadmium, zinc and mercury transporting ATPase [Pseudomonas chlororaphis subsp. aureofaciens]